MLPPRIGPYRIVRRIGRGGMGTVYMGIDDASCQTAAVKLLSADMAHHPDFRERFKGEIETLRKLNHPNIVQIFGFGEEDDLIYYSMEFVAGSSLEEQLAKGRVFSWRETADFGISIARALRHAHDRGVIHRDIKPGNLLLTEGGTPKLSDFGIARWFGNDRLTSVGSVLGTAEFMAPEQAEGRMVDPRSDLYSLGGVLYVLLARRPLYQARTFAEMIEKQRFEKPAPLRQFAPDIPTELEQIIHRLLEKDPDQRFATATMLERRMELMLESFAALPPGDAKPVTVDPPQAEGPPSPIDPLAMTVAATNIYKSLVPMEQPGEQTAGEQDRIPEEGAANAEPLDSPSRTSGLFVPVRPGELDEPHSDRGAGSWISPQTIALVIGLVAIWLVVWWSLQPLSADALYGRIQRHTDGDQAEASPQTEEDIGQFLNRFPNDSRAAVLKEKVEQIEIARLERRMELQAKGVNVQASISPVEQSYLDALNAYRTDPEAGIAKFQAMIDLFASPGETSGRTWRCVSLARRRLSECRKLYESQSKEQFGVVERRLDRADEFRKTDPARAEAIYRAVKFLYEDKAWAKKLVQRAQAALDKTANAPAELAPAERKRRL
jgi:eukaryotic-like serine/threonine-protein kinase